nr:expressed protein [Hymenolepis microstoma]
MNLKLVLTTLLILAFLRVCTAIPTTTTTPTTTAIPNEPVTSKDKKATSPAVEQTRSAEATVTAAEAEEENKCCEEKGNGNCNCHCYVPTQDCCYECPICEMEPYVPSIDEVLVNTLPNIPYDLAGALNRMNPELVSFVIKRHPNLDYLLLYTDSPTLEYIVRSTPKFEKYLSQLPPESIYDVLFKIPYPCYYLLSVDKLYAGVIAYKLPIMRSCFPPTPVTTTTTTTTTTMPPSTTPEPSMVPEEHFTKEEMEVMKAKVPSIRRLLVRASSMKLKELRGIIPDFTIIFNEFNDDFIKTLNSLNATEMSRKLLWTKFNKMSSGKPAVVLFASLFE